MAILVSLSLVFSLMPLLNPSRAMAANGFIGRSVNHLILDGTNFRFTGLNIYNANSDGTCGPVVDLDQSLSDIGPGKAVIRAWFFQNMATTAGSRDWSRMDQTLATAAAHGVRVIPVLTNQWADCDGGYGFKTKTWYETGYADPDPSGTVSYRDWVAEIVDRYKDNPTVAFWQLTNEAEVQDVEGGDCSLVVDPAETLRTWAEDVAGLVKSIDSNHLVSLGTIGGGQCGTQGAEYEYVHSLPEIDLCEYHDYGSPLEPLPGDQFNGFEVRVQQCITNLGKPLFVGEAGIIPNDVGGLPERADAIAAKLAAQFGQGASGFLAWAYLDPPSPGTFDIGAGDPILGVLELDASVDDGLKAYVVPSPAGFQVDTTDVNDSGLAVGGRGFVTGSVIPLPFAPAFKWRAPVGGDTGDSAVSYIPLPPTGSPPSWGLSESVNGAGVIAGSYAADGSFGLFRYDPTSNSSIDLGRIDDGLSHAFGINELGVVVGQSGQRPFLWSEGSGIRELSYGGFDAAATDVNQVGLIVGYGRATSADPPHVLVWDAASPSGAPLDLGPAGGTSLPRVSVNNLGQIVAPAGLWTPDGSGGYVFSTVGGTPTGIADNGVIPLYGFDGRLANTDGTTRTLTLSDPAANAVSPEAISPSGRYLLVRVSTDAGSYDAVVDLGPSTASGFVVDDPGDDTDVSPGDGVCGTASGTCTLRAAIEETNALASPSPQLITFSVSAPIRPTAPLPAVSSSAILDGTTSGCDGSTPAVELDGSLLGGLDDGLLITGGNTIVRGLLIHSFPGSGVEITGPGGNRIECSFIGTDGSNDLGNGFGISVHGSPVNEIGGGEPDAGNLISGNGGTGVTIRNPGADANKVQGNRIGTDSTGESSIPNGIGVFVTTGATGTLIGGEAPGDGNVISGNTNQGVSVTSPSTVGTNILGNLIGTNATGSTSLGNTFGVSIEAVDTWVGDGTETGRNIISGQSQHGVTVAGTASGTFILGNHIGTDVNGTVPVPNRSGVWIAQTGDTFVGGDQLGEGNLISGNTLAGVQLVLGAHDNVIAGNRIGAGLNGETSGAAALGNGGYGVILDNATENAVGGMGTGEGNVIAQSSGPGVLIFGGSSNTVLGNSVTDNGGLGIDHGDDGVTSNSGPGITPSDNESDGVLNYPILTSVATDGSDTEVIGELQDTIPNTTFHIEFFSNAVCDPSGHGEGATLIGIANSGTPVQTDAAGNGSFTVSLPLATTIGDAVAATATGGGKGTSEFSSCKSVELADESDSTPPILMLPGDQTAIAQSSSGAAVTFTATAIDDVDGDVPVVCSPASGSVFPIGDSTVTCTATDASGNTAEGDFAVSVVYGTADLSITKDDVQDPIVIGDTAVWGLTVTNAGPDPAIEVVVSDALPPGVNWLTATTPDGVCAHGGGLVSCTIGALQPGTSTTVTITASTSGLDPSTTTLLNLASAGAATIDPDPSNNDAAETTSITVAASNACQQPDDGSPRTWAFGDNYWGQLGTGSIADSTVPLSVSGLNQVTDVASGGPTTLVLLADGIICGFGFEHSLGLGGTGHVRRPIPLSLPPATVVAGGYTHNLAIVDGDVWGLGSNSRYQAGYGTTGSRPPSPIPIIPTDTTNPEFVDVAAGFIHSLALTSDGRVYTVGANWGAGLLGDGSANDPPVLSGHLQPVTVLPAGAVVNAIASSGFGNFVLLSDGRLLYWGASPGGVAAFTPIEILPEGGWPAPLTMIDSNHGGVAGVLALDADGRVWTWNLAPVDGSSAPSFDVTNLAVEAAISGGADIAYDGTAVLVRTTDHRLWAWGQNNWGQLDNGSTTSTILSPVPIGNLETVQAFDTGSLHSVVVGSIDPGLLPQVEGAAALNGPDDSRIATTDDDGDPGASPYDPIETTVEFVPQDDAGLEYIKSLRLYVTETPVGTTTVPDGFEILGYQVQIVDNQLDPAPTPWTVTFKLQLTEAQLTQGQAYVDSILIQKDGIEVSPCDGATDPCVQSRSISGDDAVLTILSRDFSLWTFAIPIPSADAGGPYVVEEGSDVELDATGSTSPFGDHANLLYHWLDYVSDPTSPTPTFTGADDFQGEIALIVHHPTGGSDSASAQLTVTNAPPSITEITGPPEPLAVGESANLEVRFDDPGVLDTHTVSADFGDGQVGSGVIDQPSRTGSLSHTYEEPGVYRVGVTIEDDDGGVASQFYEFVVVYDPSGGFVTGGGWIESPPGAYTPAPELAGKASFGFVSKYKKGRAVPDGNTEFQFRAADFNFASDAYDWLVVAGERAQFKGTGTVNGAGDYGFLLTAVDGQRLGPDHPDRFRIKIWDRASGMVVYDNQLGDADDAEIVTEIGGGAIVIHDGR